MDETEIRQKGLEALSQSLGYSGMIKFLQQFEPPNGDYTRDREQWLASTLPVAIDPIYRTLYPNQDIDILITDVYVQIRDREELIGDCQIYLSWLHTPKVKIAGKTSIHSMLSIGEYKLRLSFLQKKQEYSLLVTNTHRSDEGLQFQGSIKDLTFVHNEADDLSYVIFHVPNFSDFQGTWITSNGRDGWNGRVILEDEEWLITIDKTKEFKGLDKSIRESGGYAITHVGKIEKKDGTQFSIDKADDLLNCLHYFFSFVRCGWSSPILVVGFDEHNVKSWEDHKISNLDSGQNILSWFNHTGSSLENLFPGFRKCWQDKDLSKIIKIVIHWYIESAKLSLGVEGSVVVQQIGLELLANHRGLENGSAYEKIKRLLEGFCVPVYDSLPNKELSDLIRNDQNLQDSLSLMPWFRNKLVHSKPSDFYKVTELSSPAKQCLWRIGKLYFDLTLLALFEYKDKYLKATENYVMGQEGELVPWMSEDEVNADSE
ncbi:MAG: hypothetical protein HC924_19260 [Synechococcaceae cyanobacterium SM2_3_2]|nr:hypothetical protein [Synechococcaceae cyanobacterium SM2_3_2]